MRKRDVDRLQDLSKLWRVTVRLRQAHNEWYGYKFQINARACMHPMGRFLEIGYALVPGERGKGYCTEAVKIMVDYLFLTKEAICIQALTDVGNIASQRILEKVGFRKEGTIRKRFFNKGRWVDYYAFSILREEWKEAKILAKT